MRLTRMVIEAGRHTIALDLHPRLTVITGVGDLERESLAGELLGAMGRSRPGVHVEVTTDDGRHLALFRPASGQARLVDVERALDVTPTEADGGVDLYAQHGLDLATARRALKVTPADLTTQARADVVVARLADVDQTALWAAAARVRVTDEALQAESAAAGTAPEDAELIDRIEARHAQVEGALETMTRSRRLARLVTAVGVLGCIPALAIAPLLALPLVGITVATLAVAFLFKARVDRAQRAEQEALDAAGAESYLGFQVRRVDGLVTTDQARRHLLEAAAEHRAAAAQWFDLAGDTSVDWALEHHAEVSTAARLRADVRNLGVMSSSAPGDGDMASDLAHALLGRMARARTLGDLGETFPLVVDEVFRDLDPALKVPLLELLARSAGDPQVILLTADEEVASWARLEALTGSLSVLEPTPEPEPARAGDVVA
ncbi:hypothetical protein PO878_19580 [Iamia majanohamensis]|uniref:Uncharacterized protein n=1 Tax=Iamia majanohamensis TaxID=467976 RepID=A0AAF0BTE9_9ACTN|nr:hypothetical protein [Iamia majanohamensis]WCO66697.1 hypothetical protein PO878_19580 [Iamia majanohamensis]